MPGKDRKRRLARERYQRNIARRTAKRARNHRLKRVLGASTVVVVVLAGASFAGIRYWQQRVAAATAECSYTRLPQQQRTKAAEFVGLPPEKFKHDTDYRATISTNQGNIVIDLFTKKAPCTVNSLRFLAGKNFYSDTKCHRLVTKGIHVLQCGDPSGTGRGGPGYSFPDENLEGATYPRGTVAMANSGPNTNGSQFFVVYEKGGLQPKYTPFGKIIRGLGIVDKIAEAGVAEDGTAPKKKVVITDVSVAEKATGKKA